MHLLLAGHKGGFAAIKQALTPRRQGASSHERLS